MSLKYNVDTQIILNIGDPMHHSCATYMHNAVYRYANVNAVNITAIIKKGGLPKVIEAAKTLGATGFDLTTPHKADIVDHLDECEPAAQAFKCVNCVKIEDNRLIGIGVDGMGLCLAVQSRLGSVKGRNVLIIGAGAVAGLAANELCKCGVKSITIVNRTIEKASFIAETLKKLYGFNCKYGSLDEDYLAEVASDITLAIQCTTLGRKGSLDCFKSLEFVKLLPNDCFAVDVLYPQTQFLSACQERGLAVMNGQRMMVFQQKPKMKFRFNVDLNDDAIEEIEEAVEVGIAMVKYRDRNLIEKNN